MPAVPVSATIDGEAQIATVTFDHPLYVGAVDETRWKVRTASWTRNASHVGNAGTVATVTMSGTSGPGGSPRVQYLGGDGGFKGENGLAIAAFIQAADMV
ncbi:MAG: hypothetical protein JRD89_12015 [Deltaproteobacteria bacterium]|nr:hypothetical protein [Deltaproteobacteria bacterium]